MSGKISPNSRGVVVESWTNPASQGMYAGCRSQTPFERSRDGLKFTGTIMRIAQALGMQVAYRVVAVFERHVEVAQGWTGGGAIDHGPRFRS